MTIAEVGITFQPAESGRTDFLLLYEPHRISRFDYASPNSRLDCEASANHPALCWAVGAKHIPYQPPQRSLLPVTVERVNVMLLLGTRILKVIIRGIFASVVNDLRTL